MQLSKRTGILLVPYVGLLIAIGIFSYGQLAAKDDSWQEIRERSELHRELVDVYLACEQSNLGNISSDSCWLELNKYANEKGYGGEVNTVINAIEQNSICLERDEE